MENKQNDALLIAAKAVVKACIKNPPGFYNGNMTCQVPINVFKRLENAVNIININPYENDEDEQSIDDVKKSTKQTTKVIQTDEDTDDKDNYYTGFPISFV